MKLILLDIVLVIISSFVLDYLIHMGNSATRLSSITVK
jgi:hypothetical protein